MTNDGIGMVGSDNVDFSFLDLSLNSLGLLLFSYVNYRNKVGFYKRISNAHRRRRETPPILDFISKMSGIVFTSPDVLLTASEMTKLSPMPCKEMLRKISSERIMEGLL